MSTPWSPDGKTVKTSISIGVREHALWGACASLSGMDRNAFAVRAILASCRERGVVLTDRRRRKGQDTADDRPEIIGEISPADPEDAA